MQKALSTCFVCPNCGAVYQVIRGEAGPETMDRGIACRSCGGPLLSREGGFVLKYFLVERSRVQALGRRSGWRHVVVMAVRHTFGKRD